MIIENDPFRLVLDAFEKLYPNKKAEIYFNDADFWNAYGVTLFKNDGKTIIYIDPDYSVRKATAVLIHELAHVAVGYDAGHGKDFLQAQDKIKKEYLKKITLQ